MKRKISIAVLQWKTNVTNLQAMRAAKLVALTDIISIFERNLKNIWK